MNVLYPFNLRSASKGLAVMPSVYFSHPFATPQYFGGVWPRGLRLCNQNPKVLASNPTRRAAGVRDPTLLCGSRWPSGPIFKNIVINIAYKDFLAATLNDLLEALQKGEQRWENVRKKSDVNFYCIVYYESRCRNFITRNNDWTKITLSFKYYFSKVKKSGEIKF